MSLAVLANGDTLTMSGTLATVASLKASTNASGIVTFSGPGDSQIKAQVYRAAGYTQVVTTGDDYWRCGLVTDAASRAAVVVDDPYYGRRISGPGVWNATSSAWSATVTLGREYGGRLQRGDVSVVASHADVIPKWGTQEDGTISGLAFGGTYPYASLVLSAGTYIDGGTKLGRFYTDASGFVRDWNPYTGTGGPIIAPRGHGSWGQTAADYMHAGGDAPTPEATLSSLWLYYLQERIELTAGATTVLNVEGVDIGITGPASATFVAQWEDGWFIETGSLNGAGVGTITNVPPGHYAIALYHASDVTKGLRRQSVHCAVPGSQATIAFPTTWSSTALNSMCGYIYAAGASGISTTIMGKDWPVLGVSQWVALGTTNATGWFQTNVAGMVVTELAVEDATYGAAHFDGTIPGTWWDPCLAGALAGIVAFDGKFVIPSGEPPAIIPWGPRGGHSNLPAATSMGYAQSKHDGTQYPFRATADGMGIRTDPLPGWFHETGYSAASTDDRILYKLVDSDGTSTGQNVALTWDTAAPWAAGSWYMGAIAGNAPYGEMGGKAWGNIVNYSDTAINANNRLNEADRMGIQFGELNALYLRVRLRKDGTAICQTLTAIECPYCQGPLETEPGSPVPRGCCRNCEQAFAVTSAMTGRTYAPTPTVAALSGLGLRVLEQTRGGAYRHRDYDYYWRPDDYQENTTYQTGSGRGQVTNAPRWVAQHAHLGSWLASAWVGNETISQIEASQGRTLGPTRLKVIFSSGYTYTGGTLTFRATLERGDAAAETQTFTIANGYGRADAWGTYVPINRSEPVEEIERDGGTYDSDTGLYLRVTDLSCTNGGPADIAACEFSLVNMSPHLQNTAGLGISHQTASPYALEWQPVLKRNPDLCQSIFGLEHLVYRNADRNIALKRTPNGGRTWTTSNAVTTDEDHDFPAVTKRDDGDLVVMPTKLADTSEVKVWRSRSDGATFASTADTIAGTRADAIEAMKPIQHATVYQAGSAVFRAGTRNFSTLLTRGGATSATITTDAADARAPLVRKVTGELVTAIENAGGYVKLWRSPDDGGTWASAANSYVGSDPDLTLGPHNLEYLTVRSGATQKFFRGLNCHSTQLNWKSQLAAGGTTLQTSTIITNGTDAERAATLKLNGHGRMLAAAVTEKQQVKLYWSKDDGLSWSHQSTP